MARGATFVDIGAAVGAAASSVQVLEIGGVRVLSITLGSQAVDVASVLSAFGGGRVPCCR